MGRSSDAGLRVLHQFEMRDAVVRATINSYRGREYLSLRVWWEPEPGKGLQPTKRGITVSAEALEDLEACVTAFRRALNGIERSSSTWSEAVERG